MVPQPSATGEHKTKPTQVHNSLLISYLSDFLVEEPCKSLYEACMNVFKKFQIMLRTMKFLRKLLEDNKKLLRSEILVKKAIRK
jgi:hypothetical protein